MPLAIPELIRRERRPLPPRERAGGRYRRWAADVCQAEVDHRNDDFWRAVSETGVPVDRFADPACVQMGQFAHEAQAGAALLWLSHLQAHESDRRGPWACVRWNTWDAERRATWWAKWFELWDGFQRSVERYRAARRALAAQAMREAA
jgi:hypothetical protein